jgi:hypothetical protein
MLPSSGKENAKGKRKENGTGPILTGGIAERLGLESAYRPPAQSLATQSRRQPLTIAARNKATHFINTGPVPFSAKEQGDSTNTRFHDHPAVGKRGGRVGG